jgi:hypothetical protein
MGSSQDKARPMMTFPLAICCRLPDKSVDRAACLDGQDEARGGREADKELQDFLPGSKVAGDSAKPRKEMFRGRDGRGGGGGRWDRFTAISEG